ncbi:MAG: hypothetical protein EA403_08205 [Spirochaetaceae bacterium]|nr:MAG: hypothetical protein EA403_08205 [Spirochaetaceae bacterium]
MTITPLTDGLVSIHRSGEAFLGIVTYIPAKPVSTAALARENPGHGWMVHGATVTPWRIAGVTQHEGRIVLYGEAVAARPLSEFLRLDWEHLLPYLARVADGFRVAEREGLEIGPVHTRSILLTDDGGLLFLPAALSAAIATQQSAGNRMEFFSVYTHPGRTDRENRSFALAVMAYRGLTGEFPFSTTDEDELRNLMRARAPMEAWLRNPEILPEVSQQIDAVLRPEHTDTIDAAVWTERFRQWRHESVFRPITDEERSEILARAAVADKRSSGVFRRREFWRKHWKRVVTIALVVALVGSVPGTIIRNRLQPRQTAGLPPTEVVRAFYGAINEFNHALMEDAVVDGAAREEIRMVTNLFVMSRMRMAVEMTSGFIDADEWRREGSPPIPEGAMPWGTALLELEPIRVEENEVVYQARFEMWMPGEPGEPGRPVEQAPSSTDTAVVERVAAQGFRRTERLWLRPDGEDWVIFRIHREEESVIDPAEFDREE